MSRKRNNVERAFAAYLLLNHMERGEFSTLCKGFERGREAEAMLGTSAPKPRRRAPAPEPEKVDDGAKQPAAARAD